jgi:hypothetical protein
MNTCYVVRSSRPVGLFSFGLLDGLPVRLRRPYLREPRRLLHQPVLRLPRQPLCPGTDFSHTAFSTPVKRISLFARDSRGLREKRDWSEDSSVRVAPVSRTTYERRTEDGGIFEQPMGSAGAVRDMLQPSIPRV